MQHQGAGNHFRFSTIKNLSHYYATVITLLMLNNTCVADIKHCNNTDPLWGSYKRHFVQPDGRVVEHSQGARTTSEGQAYALFHALVANDQTQFVKVLSWAEDNLAKGALGDNLMAWSWGLHKNGSWGVLDNNVAADADMWMAYTLLEAGRHWNAPHYQSQGQALLARIENELVKTLPNLGPMVLPGKIGFNVDNDSWRLNPSYLPIQQLRYFSNVGDRLLWQGVINSTERLLTITGAGGAVPDWTIYHRSGSWHPAEEDGPIGSYDAIRVYLWLGMLNNGEPLKRSLLHKLKFSCDSSGYTPEKINTRSMQGSGDAPIGFKAALAPYYQAKQSGQCLSRALQQIDTHWNNGLLSDKPVYYDQNLAMFSLAWLKGRFSFDAQGRLTLQWTQPC